MIATPHYGSGECMGYLDHGIGGLLGSALVVVVIVLAIAWLLVPIWVWNIREDFKRHIYQQEKLLKATESLLHEARQQTDRTR